MNPCKESYPGQAAFSVFGPMKSYFQCMCPYRWVTLADNLLANAHRRSFEAWLRLARQQLALETHEPLQIALAAEHVSEKTIYYI